MMEECNQRNIKRCGVNIKILYKTQFLDSSQPGRLKIMFYNFFIILALGNYLCYLAVGYFKFKRMNYEDHKKIR
jgi:hypothetical protein